MTETIEKQGEDANKKKRTAKPIKKFPNYTIEEALKIPSLIKSNNSGNPWDTEQLALALNVKKGGNIFYYMTAASRDYGFTSGTRDTTTVTLESLGRKYVYAQSTDEVRSSIEAAFNNIELFKQVHDYYKNGEPADDTFFRNALINTFKIDESFLDDFIRIYKENVKFSFSSEQPTLSENPTIQQSKSDKTRDISVNKIFVIMPFTEKTEYYPKGFFIEVLKQLIEPSAEKAGCIAETADRDGSDIIHSTIIQAINKAPIILADLTEHNPNVLFELGIAIALKKPVVLIKTENTGQIFDIDNTIRVFSYNQNLWTSTLINDIPNLSKRISAVINNIGREKSYFDTFMGD